LSLAFCVSTVFTILVFTLAQPVSSSLFQRCRQSSYEFATQAHRFQCVSSPRRFHRGVLTKENRHTRKNMPPSCLHLIMLSTVLDCTHTTTDRWPPTYPTLSEKSDAALWFVAEPFPTRLDGLLRVHHSVSMTAPLFSLVAKIKLQHVLQRAPTFKVFL